MAKRNKFRQSQHDWKVLEIALNYYQHGYDVYADIRNWRQPGLRNGHKPDVVAKAGIHSIIFEVETPDSVERDRNQRVAFERYAQEHPNVEFKLVVV